MNLNLSIKKIVIMLLLAVSIANSRDLSFSDEIRYQGLLREFRCLACQNQSLVDSRLPFAFDLRRQVYSRISDGATNKKIRSYVVSRYGEAVSYNHTVSYSELLFIFFPFTVLLLFVYLFMRRVVR